MGKNKKKGTSKKTWAIDCRMDSAFDFALLVLKEASKNDYSFEMKCNFCKIAYENSKEVIAKAQTDPIKYKLNTAMKLFNRNLREIFKVASELGKKLGISKDLSEDTIYEREIKNPYNIFDIHYKVLDLSICQYKLYSNKANLPSLDEFKRRVYREYQYPSIVEIDMNKLFTILVKGNQFKHSHLKNSDGSWLYEWFRMEYNDAQKLAKDLGKRNVNFAELLPTNQIRIILPDFAQMVFDVELPKDTYAAVPNPIENNEYLKFPYLIQNYHHPSMTILDDYVRTDNGGVIHPTTLSTKWYGLEPIINLLETAASNPDSVADINITLYRVAKESKIIDAVIKATQNKIRCNIFFEVSARGEIENDCTQIYKLIKDANMAYLNIKFKYSDVKVHSKMILIRMKENNGFKPKIGVFSTGNYNEDTAPIYKDYHYITLQKDETEMIERNFNILWNSSQPILSSISSILIKEIYSEIEKGKNGRIWIQTNHLDNDYIISLLKTAISKGVDVKLIVRTTKGFHSKDIKNCKTVVGKYLEHSRVYIFGGNKNSKDKTFPRIYLSSSDVMFRNLYNRFEAYLKIPYRDLENTIYIENEFVRLWDGKQ